MIGYFLRLYHKHLYLNDIAMLYGWDGKEGKSKREVLMDVSEALDIV